MSRRRVASRSPSAGLRFDSRLRAGLIFGGVVMLISVAVVSPRFVLVFLGGFLVCLWVLRRCWTQVLAFCGPLLRLVLAPLALLLLVVGAFALGALHPVLGALTAAVTFHCWALIVRAEHHHRTFIRSLGILWFGGVVLTIGLFV